ncbi:hypothetical protein MKX03_026447 [Papaver bracteatum]|nr:hypothetical protein MKX03_026447 [Papaver bracteatum]
MVGGPAVSPAGSFGLIAKQMRVSRQEKPNCESVSFDRDAANCFQHYFNETLAFAYQRMVNFIYEMPQQGTEENLVLMKDAEDGLKEGGADVHFEAFQMGDVCVKLFEERWFETE